MTIRQQIADALAEVYSGAGPDEVAALIDKLADRDLIIVRIADLVTLPHWANADDYRGVDEDVM